MKRESWRPSRGLRSGATRATASRRQHGPLLRLRGAPGTQDRPRSDGHWFRPTRTAFRRPPGSREIEPTEPTFAGRRPPLRFRSSTEVHRSTPTPSRGPEGRRRTMLPLLGFRALRHMPGRRTRSREASSSAACRVRGFDPPRGVHHRPSRALRRGASMGFTLQGVLLEAIRTPCEAPCPLGVLRVDSPRPPGERADVVAFKALIPTRARSALPDPEGPGASMPSWVSSLQSSYPAPVAAALCSRHDPLARVGWDQTSRPTCVSGCCSARDLAAPLGVTGSRGVRHRVPSRNRVRVAQGGGLMTSPRGQRTLHAAPDRS
jgi:hypothetical protein